MKRSIALGLVLGCLLGLAGCAGSLTGDTYSREEARKVQTVKFGQVVGLRPVVLEGTKTGVGTISGAAIGGIAGSGVGQGRGSAIVGVIGAVAGGVIGSKVEEAATRTQGIEVTVKLDSGETLAVVQEASPNDRFALGDRVRLLSTGGNTRVVH